MPTFFFGILMILFFSVCPNRRASACRRAAPKRCAITPWSGLARSRPAPSWIIPAPCSAGADSDHRERLGLQPLYPRQHARSAAPGLRAHRARQGLDGTLRDHQARPAQRLDPLCHDCRFEIPALFSGAIITETIFSWPGMGRLYFSALGDNDYPVAMAIFFIIAVLTVFATLLRDILIRWSIRASAFHNE